MKNLGKHGSPTCKQVNAVDIVSFLDSIGHKPTRSSHPQYWYLSPLRDENTASFKVNRKSNTWFDFGIQEGGSLVDLCVKYYNCTVKEVLAKFAGIQELEHVPQKKAEEILVLEATIADLHISPLLSIPLLRYIMSRRIEQSVAQKFCQEAHYRVKEKDYYAIAFENRAGGYELRSKYFKGSNSPKDYSYLDNKASLLCVFEGFFDFLSFMTITKNQPIPAASFIILNSVAFLSKCQSVIMKYPSVLLYLDNDHAGDRATVAAEAWGEHIHDQRVVYKGYKDLNEWACNIGLSRELSLFNRLV